MKTLLSILMPFLLMGHGCPVYGQEQSTEFILILNKSGDTAWQIDAHSGIKIKEYRTGDAPHEIAVSPDNSRAIITNYGSDKPGNTLTILDLNNRTIDKTISLGKYQRPHGVQWFSDGSRAVVTAESQQAVLIVDINTGTILSSIGTNQKVSHMVALGPRQKKAFVTNLGSASLSILDLEEKKSSRIIKTGKGAEGISVVPHRREVWITNRGANTVSIIDIPKESISRTLHSSGFPIRAELSPDEKIMAVSNAQSSEVTIFEVEKRKQLQKFSTVRGKRNGMPIGLTFSDNGHRLYVANSAINEIAVFETESWQRVDTFSTGQTPDGIAYFSSN